MLDTPRGKQVRGHQAILGDEKAFSLSSQEGLLSAVVTDVPTTLREVFVRVQ